MPVAFEKFTPEQFMVAAELNDVTNVLRIFFTNFGERFGAHGVEFCAK